MATPSNEEWRRERWRLLAEWEVRQKEARGWYQLTCDDCHDCDRTTFPIPPLNSTAWPACPVKLVRSTWWQYVVGLYNARNVTALADWPHRYAAWVVDALEELVPAVDRKAAEDLKRKQKG